MIVNPERSRFYLISCIVGALFWGLLLLINVSFVNMIFALMAYVWHFALLTPGMKEMIFVRQNKMSMMSIVFKSNYYLQMFIRFEKIPFTTSLVRAISPLIFTFFLLVVGGSGNILFTLLGSLIFELVYLKLMPKFGIKKTIIRRDDLEIPPAIPTEEISHESVHSDQNHQTDFEKKI